MQNQDAGRMTSVPLRLSSFLTGIIDVFKNFSKKYYLNKSILIFLPEECLGCFFFFDLPCSPPKSTFITVCLNFQSTLDFFFLILAEGAAKCPRSWEQKQVSLAKAWSLPKCFLCLNLYKPKHNVVSTLFQDDKPFFFFKSCFIWFKQDIFKTLSPH